MKFVLLLCDCAAKSHISGSGPRNKNFLFISSKLAHRAADIYLSEVFFLVPTSFLRWRQTSPHASFDAPDDWVEFL